MKHHHTVITFTNRQGSRSLTLNRSAKILVVLMVAASAIIFLANILIIQLLKTQISDYHQKRLEVTRSLNQLIAQNSDLSKQIEQKNEDLKKLNRIENLVGLSTGKQPKQEGDLGNYQSRVDQAQSVVLKRSKLLSVIPNGLPLRKPMYISSGFGYRIHPISHRRLLHKGLDFPVNKGTPVLATADGVVEVAGHSRGFGMLVKLMHSYGFRSYYAHNSQLAVKKGDFIRKGQIIAYSGNSGHSTGPHLHYEVHFLDYAINPAPFLRWNIGHFDRIFSTQKDLIPWNQILSSLGNNTQEHP